MTNDPSRQSRFALICGALLALACSTTDTHRVITGTPGAKHQGPVSVYMAGAPTPVFEEVAIVQAVGKGGHADLEHVVKGLQKEAASLGCNSVVNVKVDQGSGTASGTAICARIPPTNQPPAPAPVAPPPPVPAPPPAPIATADAAAPTEPAPMPSTPTSTADAQAPGL